MTETSEIIREFRGTGRGRPRKSSKAKAKRELTPRERKVKKHVLKTMTDLARRHPSLHAAILITYEPVLEKYS